MFVFQKLEDRVASDQELKLTELLRYYTRDIQAAKVTQLHILNSIISIFAHQTCVLPRFFFFLPVNQTCALFFKCTLLVLTATEFLFNLKHFIL